MSTPSEFPDDGAWPAGREVPSPCNSVCTMDSAGAYCTGCLRTLEEIAGWSGFDTSRRLDVWKLVRRRRARQACKRVCSLPERGNGRL